MHKFCEKNKLFLKLLFITTFLSISALAQAKLSRHDVISFDQTKLSVVLAHPKQEIKAALLIVHGLQSHSGWHEKNMKILSEKGILSIAFDRRGSGLSQGKRGHFDSSEELQKDLKVVFDFLAKQISTETPIYILGNSFGFLPATIFAHNNTNKLAGIILLTPASATTSESDYNLSEKFKILISPGHTKHHISYSNDFITTNEAGLEIIKNDSLFLNHFTSSFLRNTLLMRIKANRLYPSLELNSLVILAKHDRIIDNSKTQANLSNTEMGSAEIIYIDGDHDLGLSGASAEVTEAIISFITK